MTEGELWTDPKAPPATPGANSRELCCPAFAHPLPAAVRIVAEDFAREGVDQELATNLAVKASDPLRVPA